MGMIHDRQRLPLGLEAGVTTCRVSIPGLMIFSRDHVGEWVIPARPRRLCALETAFADLLEKFVPANLGAGAFGQSMGGFWVGRRRLDRGRAFAGLLDGISHWRTQPSSAHLRLEKRFSQVKINFLRKGGSRYVGIGRPASWCQWAIRLSSRGICFWAAGSLARLLISYGSFCRSYSWVMG